MAFAAVGALSTLALSSLPALALPTDLGVGLEAPFPFATIADHGAAGLDLTLLSDVLGSLEGVESVTLTGVPLPDGDPVDLVLERQRVAAPDALVWVDGAPRHPLGDAASLWAGKVRREEHSDVFLALSEHGSRGWISRAETTYHLLAGPGAAGDWAAPSARLVSDAVVRAEGHPPDFRCASGQVSQPATPALPLPLASIDGPLTGVEAGSLGILQAFVAVESDSQYYDVFGDLGASASYALALFGAVSQRYRQDIGVVLSLSYLALYTDSSQEPWTAGDTGGICIDQLFEFQNAGIAGAIPARGDIFHFLSGSNLQCGVAYLPGLCDPTFKYSVSGNIEGLLEFPVEQGPLNWDFIVVAHEIGHNFGAPHTHDWCPQPVDECAPDWAGWGTCQDEQTCLADGTIMSYCHLCPGGYQNIDLHFHDVSKAAMRDLAENTCLEPYSASAPPTAGALATQLRR